MAGLCERVLSPLPIAAMADTGMLDHRHSLPPARVALAPMPAGQVFLENWQIRELPDQGLWQCGYYDSYAPPLFTLHDAQVQSSAGIIAVGPHVAAETLALAEPQRHGFRRLARGIAVPSRPVRPLSGCYISLLAGGEGNFYHAMLDGLARLMAVPANYLSAANGILVPRGGARLLEAVALLDLLPSLRVVEVDRAEALRVETLVLPLSVSGDFIFHPVVADFFTALAATLAPAPRLPRRLYVDRRGSKARPLANEAAVIGALGRYGFVPVRLENLSLADQARLFRGADAVVAPHGAGLTNLGFCRPGTIVVELQMDAYCHWGFRHLAGLQRLTYDCVLGRACKPWADLDGAFHMTPWEVSTMHVVAAVAQYLDQAVAA